MGIIKRKIAICLIFLMCINSFGAVVSDNDGSAFITKAEFDSLKNNFQSQIDTYNQSIDSKIDGAIASYLSGITVAQEAEVILPVTNYNEIYWVRDWYIYGSYIEWTPGPTDATAASSATKVVKQNVWFKPFWDKRRGGVRQNDAGFNIITALARADGNIGLVLKGKILPSSACGASCAGTDTTTDQNRYMNPRPMVIVCENKTNSPLDIMLLQGDDDNLFKWEYANLERTFVTQKGGTGYPYVSNNLGASWAERSATGWAAGWALKPLAKNDPLADQWLTVNPTEDGEIANFTIIANTQSGSSTALYPVGSAANPIIDWYFRYPLAIKSYECFPVLSFGIDNHNTYKPTITRNKGWRFSQYYNLDTFARGMHEQIFHSSSYGAQCTDLHHMMLGKDNTDEVNIYRSTTTIHNGNAGIETDYSDWAAWDIEINTLELGGVRPYVTGYPGNYVADPSAGQVTYATPSVIQWNVPYFERYPLGKITSGLFKNGENNLKIGSGLPICLSAPMNGIMNIDLDWVTERSVGTPPTNTAIEIDVKTTNFLDSVNTYYQGSVNGGTNAELHDYVINSADKKAKIAINVHSGDSVWIRIAPNDNAAGLKARLTNLSAKVVKE